MHRYRNARDRDLYLLAHGLLRLALSWHAPGTAPAAWRFRTGRHGRPEIAGPAGDPRVRFNLSHTDGLVACLLTVGFPGGVDVEHLDRDTDVQPLARSCLTAAERQVLAAAEPARRTETFLRHWTLKEAYAKARGLGLALPFDKVSLRLHGDRAQVSDDPTCDDPGGWQLRHWRVGERHLAATALAAAAVVHQHSDLPRS